MRESLCQKNLWTCSDRNTSTDHIVQKLQNVYFQAGEQHNFQLSGDFSCEKKHDNPHLPVIRVKGSLGPRISHRH